MGTKAVWTLVLLGIGTPASAVDKSASKHDLPAALAKRERSHRQLYLHVKESETALCRFVADSIGLRHELLAFIAGARFPKGTDPTEWSIAVSERFPGAYAYVVDSAIRSGLDWKVFASLADPRLAPLLQAVRDLEKDDVSVWIDLQTDYGGCHRPEAAQAAIRRLADAWKSQPGCLRDALRPFVMEKLTAMSEDNCFCDTAAVVRANVKVNANLLRALPEIGPPLAEKLQALPAGPGARFTCKGGI